MRSSLECLQEFIDKNGEEWQKRLSTCMKSDEELSPDERACFQDFVEAYREAVIAGKSDELGAVKKRIANDLLADELREYIDQYLTGFYAAEPLRTLEVKDFDSAKKLADLIFEEKIVRFNPAIYEKYADFGFDAEQTFASVVNVVASLAEFTVEGNLQKKAIEEAVYTNIRITRKLSSYIAEKTDRNSEAIRAGLILRRLSENN